MIGETSLPCLTDLKQWSKSACLPGLLPASSAFRQG